MKIEAQGIPFRTFLIEVTNGSGIYNLAYHDSGWYVNGWPPTRRASVTEIDGQCYFSMDHWDATLGIWILGEFVLLTLE
ncbi:MAG TPA: hypothetical protein ENI87_11240 [bacterium]|nr:hypothetical protein [bacterium]